MLKEVIRSFFIACNFRDCPPAYDKRLDALSGETFLGGRPFKLILSTVQGILSNNGAEDSPVGSVGSYRHRRIADVGLGGRRALPCRRGPGARYWLPLHLRLCLSPAFPLHPKRPRHFAPARSSSNHSWLPTSPATFRTPHISPASSLTLRSQGIISK